MKFLQHQVLQKKFVHCLRKYFAFFEDKIHYQKHSSVRCTCRVTVTENRKCSNCLVQGGISSSLRSFISYFSSICSLLFRLRFTCNSLRGLFGSFHLPAFAYSQLSPNFFYNHCFKWYLSNNLPCIFPVQPSIY